MSYGVVWFKRDLRVHDHAALHAASRGGAVLCLYVVEPELWRQPDTSSQHYRFTLECLNDLAMSLERRGMRLLIRVGAVTEVLSQLHALAPFESVYSHEETGNAYTYQRDKAVLSWCRIHGVQWREYRQNGVIRRLRTRDGWSAQWTEFMAQPCFEVPELCAHPVPLPSQDPPPPETLCSYVFDPPDRQAGGRRQGIAVLEAFLALRSRQYRGGISSPLSAPTACSRLSPYLAYGCLSLREVVQATQRRIERLAPSDAHQRNGLRSFLSRLHWHCHFIQKLESEPEIEWRNMHRGYDGLRENDFDLELMQKLAAGRTGWPLVDGCVAMLNQTGWLNFRMRAMIVSVAAYPLWLHWRPVGLWFARCLLDYEPGIHWSQMQMQSGTTGMNTTRVYNPIKQARDHDPHGYFVRRWVYRMRDVPDTWLFEPWRMPESIKAHHGLIGNRAPLAPLVDLESATRLAKQRLHALRNIPAVRAGKLAVVERHGSRRLPRVKAARQNGSPQIELPLEPGDGSSS